MTTTSATTSSNSVLQSYLDKQTTAKATASSTTSSSNSTSLTSATGNLTTFLKILTTQLQHQDPTSATDTNQFTQELVQFAGAEQQINTNTKLDTISNLLKSSNGMSGAIGYMGKYVEVPSTSSLPLQSGTSELGYTLDGTAANISITVQDSAGKTVATLTGTGNKGSNYISWNGKDSSGNQLADGTYTFSIGATSSTGTSVKVSDTKVIAKVTSVASNTDGTSNLGLGNMSILSTKVDSVYESGSLPSATAG